MTLLSTFDRIDRKTIKKSLRTGLGSENVWSKVFPVYIYRQFWHMCLIRDLICHVSLSSCLNIFQIP